MAKLDNEESMAMAFGLSRGSLAWCVEAGLLVPIKIGTAYYFRGKDRTRLSVIAKGIALGFSLDELARILCPRRTLSLGANDSRMRPARNDIVRDEVTHDGTEPVASSTKPDRRIF